MNDLTKLTPEELLKPLEYNGTIPREHRAEIRRRLEDYERLRRDMSIPEKGYFDV